MNPKDINKQAQDFSKSLMGFANELQKKMSSLTSDELKSVGVNIDELQKEAKAKVDELHRSMKSFENKIKTL